MFFGKLALLSVKEFSGIHGDLKIIAKKLTPVQRKGQYKKRRFCEESVVKPEGWKMLPSLVEIVKYIIKQPGSKIKHIDEIKLVTETFYHPMSKSVEKVLSELKSTSPIFKERFSKLLPVPFKYDNTKLFRVIYAVEI